MIFMRIFRTTLILCVFFVFSSGLLDQIVLILAQFETPLHPAAVNRQSCH